jgi:hypothetical protein
MKRLPPQVEEFLAKKSIAVAGVSRDPHQPANAIFKKLQKGGRRTYAINPNASIIEGGNCYPDIASLPEAVEAVMIVTHPKASTEIVKQCADAGIKHVWFHRSFGEGSVSQEAVRLGEQNGMNCVVGGCPMMFCEPVDFAHRCMRWVLRMQKRIPV